VLPGDIPFKPKPNKEELQIVEYADWAIGRFIRMVQKEKWAKNTVFVFTADHGAVVGESPYDLPLSFHHIPLIFYFPNMFTPKYYDQIGGQIDIFPTLMGLLNANFVNNTFGIDLLKEKRPYIYFSGDDKLGCLDKEFLLIHTKYGNEKLYRYTNRDIKDYSKENNAVVDSMKEYMLSNLQSAQWMIENKKTGPIN
jgi:phosphoglycerol transferase MdoB-like AlkP superfamily enzyme